MVDKPIIIKVGIFENKKVLRAVLLAAHQAGIKGICGINSVPMRIINEHNEPAFGTTRPIAGVSGNPIRTLALDFTQSARHIIDDEGLDLTLLATGGITMPDHFKQFFNAGADIAMAATAVMWDPYLALHYNYPIYS